MGIRFRKSWKVAPGVRVGVGRRSASVSLGVKGARVTKSTTGRTTTSVGIPGSGLSHVSSSGGGKGRKSAQVQQQRGPQRPPQLPQQLVQQQVPVPGRPRSTRAALVIVGVVLAVVVAAMIWG